MRKYKFILGLCSLLLGSSHLVWSSVQINHIRSTILSADQAFKVSAEVTHSDNVKLSFIIAPDRFIYKQRLSITSVPESAIDLTPVVWPRSLLIPDINDSSKMDEVYAGTFVVNFPLKNKAILPKLNIKLQGCDGKSICYPPKTYTFDLANDSQANKISSNVSLDENDPHEGVFNKQVDKFIQFYHGEITGQTLLNSLNIFELILIFFIAGIAISLTPCMYPLYPIALSTIIGNTTRDTNKGRKSILLLVLAYIHGIALIYVFMGFFAALTGKLLTTLIQTPLVMFISGGVWLILGLAMFDLIEIKLPNRLQAYIQQRSVNLSGGSYVKVFVMGILSSILLGPCVTPPLLAAIGFIVGRGEVFLGGIGLYAISLGMGVPILILALLGGKLMPKSGIWMSGVKYVMGGLIIGMSIYLVYPFFNLANSQISVGMLCLIITLIFLIIKHFRPNELDLLVHKIVPIILIALGISFNYYGVKSLVNTSPKIQISGITTIETEAQLNQIIQTSQKPVLIDFYASWCALCREMEQKTFSRADVQQVLEKYTVVKFDLSKNLPKQIETLHRYGLYGPPALIVIAKDKQVIDKMQGFIDGKDLIKHLDNESR